MQYRDVLNICYLVKAGGKTLLITGDSDFDAADFSSAFDNGSIDAAIVNPLFMQAKQGVELMRRPSVVSVIVCHIYVEFRRIIKITNTGRLIFIIRYTLLKLKGNVIKTCTGTSMLYENVIKSNVIKIKLRNPLATQFIVFFLLLEQIGCLADKQ